MSDPERLLDGELSPDIERLLRSAERDVPPAARAEEEPRRLHAAIVATGALADVGTRAPAASHLLRNVAWTGLAAVALVIGALGVRARSSSTQEPSARPVSAPVVASALPILQPASAPSGALPADDPVAMPSVRVDELPSAAAAPRAESSNDARRSTATAGDELATIDAARGELAAGHPASTLAHVQRYRVTFPARHFDGEADALEVQALAALGRIEEARTKAERFIATHPDSPYTQRVRSAAGLRDRAGHE